MDLNDNSYKLMDNIDSNISSSDELVGIDEVQKFLNRSRASVYRYTNTDLRNLNPSFNPRKLNPEYRTDQKDPESKEEQETRDTHSSQAQRESRYHYRAQ